VEDDVASDYFAAAFGPDGRLAQGYLESISFLFDPPYLRGETPKICQENADDLAKIPWVVDAFMPTIEKNLTLENPCWAKSWFYLKHSAELCSLLALAAEAVARDHKELARAQWAEVCEYARRHEKELHPVLDVMFFVNTLGWFFG